jgi:hypothetical protein
MPLVEVGHLDETECFLNELGMGRQVGAEADSTGFHLAEFLPQF